MAAQLLDGKKMAAGLEEELKLRVSALKEKGIILNNVNYTENDRVQTPGGCKISCRT